MADYTVKRFDEMPGPEGVKILAIGGIPGGVCEPPGFTELGGPEPVPDPARIA
jgi:hypothetical protein